MCTQLFSNTSQRGVCQYLPRQECSFVTCSVSNMLETISKVILYNFQFCMQPLAKTSLSGKHSFSLPSKNQSLLSTSMIFFASSHNTQATIVDCSPFFYLSRHLPLYLQAYLVPLPALIVDDLSFFSSLEKLLYPLDWGLC